MYKYTNSQKLELIRKWRMTAAKSGLTLGAVALSMGIPLQTLYSWTYKLQREGYNLDQSPMIESPRRKQEQDNAHKRREEVLREVYEKARNEGIPLNTAFYRVTGKSHATRNNWLRSLPPAVRREIKAIVKQDPKRRACGGESAHLDSGNTVYDEMMHHWNRLGQLALQVLADGKVSGRMPENLPNNVQTTAEAHRMRRKVKREMQALGAEIVTAVYDAARN